MDNNFIFQSTLPLRGATPDSCANAGSNAAYFNPHSPCGERPRQVDHATVTHDISIHTPLAGSDDGQRLEHDRSDQFQSTLPLRGATHRTRLERDSKVISIHTPLAGSDLTRSSHRTFDRFQSTLPLRGATSSFTVVAMIIPYISIHTPLAGSDEGFGGFVETATQFQSTLPLRGATVR